MGISFLDHIWLANLIHQGARQVKEPDECFFPAPKVQVGTWPGLVIEVGVSETIRQLHRDVVWWFQQHSEVKYVLLMSLDTTKKNITIEKWEWAHQPDTWSNVLEPSVTEVVTIFLNPVQKRSRTIPAWLPVWPRTLYALGIIIHLSFSSSRHRHSKRNVTSLSISKAWCGVLSRRRWPGFGNLLVSLTFIILYICFVLDA